MGMFDTVYAELDCPFCGRRYHYQPMSWEEAEKKVKKNIQRQFETRQKILQGERPLLVSQELWASFDDFTDVDAWIAQLDSLENIEKYRTERNLGLAEIQTKEFDCIMQAFYVGDAVGKYYGHYYIQEDFICGGCSNKEESVWVHVWLEIEERKLKAVLVRNPETGQPEKNAFLNQNPRPPAKNPHPSITLDSNGFHALALFNEKTGKYRARITQFPESFSFTGKTEEDLQKQFGPFLEQYRLIMTQMEQNFASWHDRLTNVCRHLPSDFAPFGEIDVEGADCSTGCLHFLKLPGQVENDWGVCSNSKSRRAGLLTFEHQGCLQFEWRREDEADENL